VKHALSFVFTLSALPTFAADPTYWNDIRPLMRKHCTVCHSAKTLNEPEVSAGLALDTLEAIRKGGKSPVVKAKDGKTSLLVTILRHPKPARRMPLDANPLPDEVVALITKWIDADMPEGTKPAETDTNTRPSTPRRKLDVTITTKAVLPKKAGVLELVLPIGPLSPIAAVAFSPDGSRLAAGSYGRVVVWDLKTGKPSKVLTNVLGAVNDLKFSPDGSQLAVAGGQPSARGDLRIFTVADWKLVATFGSHTDVVSGIAFSPDGQLLASASFDKTARVWNLSTKQNVSTFTGHSDFVHAVAFGPKGDWYATASKDRTSRLVDTKLGESRLTFSGTDQEVLSVAVTSDGKNVVTSGLDPALSWWNAQTGERTQRTGGHNTATNELLLNRAGDLVVSAGADSTVRLWNPKNFTAIRTIQVGSMVYAASANKDGKIVASGSFDGQVRVWEATTGRLLVSFVGLNDDEWLALTPEGYADVGSSFAKTARWRSNGKDLNTESVWKAVKQPGMIAKALSAEKLPDVAFADPQP
jgi:WD40 repeat protein